MDIINRFFQTASCFEGDSPSEPEDRLNEPYVHFDSVEALYRDFWDGLERVPGKDGEELRERLYGLLNAYERQGFANGLRYGVTLVKELSGMTAA